MCMTDDIIQDALDKLRGAVTIVYPMGLPPHDPIRLEFEGQEDLSGTQVMPHTHTLYNPVYMCIHVHLEKISEGSQ